MTSMMIWRILRLSLGLWSPSRVATIGVGEAWVAGFEGRAPKPPGWLDRWELRNHRRDCEARGYDPMMPWTRKDDR